MATDSMISSVSGMDAEMPDMVDEEYCVQYFGFHPQFFMNGMYNGMHSHLQEAIVALNNGILSTLKDSVTPAELRSVSRKQHELAVERLKRKFDKAEVYLHNNIFSMPPSVVLPSDQVQVDSPCTDQDMTKLDQDIEEATDRIKAVMFANAQLRSRMEEMSKIQEEFDATSDSIDTMLARVSTEAIEVARKTKAIQQVTALASKCLAHVAEL